MLHQDDEQSNIALIICFNSSQVFMDLKFIEGSQVQTSSLIEKGKSLSPMTSLETPSNFIVPQYSRKMDASIIRWQNGELTLLYHRHQTRVYFKIVSFYRQTHNT